MEIMLRRVDFTPSGRETSGELWIQDWHICMISLYKEGSGESLDSSRGWKVVSVGYILEGESTGLVEMDWMWNMQNQGNQRWLLFFRPSFYSLTGLWWIVIRLNVHRIQKSVHAPPSAPNPQCIPSFVQCARPCHQILRTILRGKYCPLFF